MSPVEKTASVEKSAANLKLEVISGSQSAMTKNSAATAKVTGSKKQGRELIMAAPAPSFSSDSGTVLQMSDIGKELSSPFSTGGGGTNFENNVQSAFVVLMLSGGVAPCVSPWPIKKIKLQGRYEGYNTDDFIAFVEERNGSRKSKLLAQIKHSLSITEQDSTFAEVIQAAWSDFRNADLFDPKCDVLALITGPLSARDIENARIVLEWARTSAGAKEFLDKVNLGKFSSEAKREKLSAFRVQLKKANKEADVGDEAFWQFLKCFHILGYDLDIQSGVTLSLLNSPIAQFTADNIPGLWAIVAKEVGSFNQSAGTVTVDTLSQEVRTAFAQRLPERRIPTEFIQPQKPQAAAPPDYFVGQYADALMFGSLLGGWSDTAKGDQVAIRQLIEGKTL